MRPNLVISPEELGRDDIAPGAPPAEVRRFSYAPAELDVVVIRAPKASYPDGVVAFWRAATACERMLVSSDRCTELTEASALEAVRSFIRGAEATYEFELRSSFVAGQRMDIAGARHETELVLMRGQKASYPDGVVSFWRAADRREEVDYSDKCKELSETEAVERVRSFIRGIDTTFRFELRSPLVAAQEMDVGPWMYVTVLIETAREYIVVRYSSTA